MEINLIWCPEDGWIPPQRHAVYEFREGFLVNRGERNESTQKNEDEVGRDAAYMRHTRIHAHGEEKTGGLGATL